MLSIENHSDLILNFEEKEILEEVHGILEVFAECMTVLQSGSSPTINLVIPFICDIKARYFTHISFLSYFLVPIYFEICGYFPCTIH
jgi:hypothetical protein